MVTSREPVMSSVIAFALSGEHCTKQERETSQRCGADARIERKRMGLHVAELHPHDLRPVRELDGLLRYEIMRRDECNPMFSRCEIRGTRRFT